MNSRIINDLFQALEPADVASTVIHVLMTPSRVQVRMFIMYLNNKLNVIM